MFDVRSATWAASLDWLFMAVGCLGVAVVVVAASGRAWLAPIGVVPALGFSRWRAVRMARRVSSLAGSEYYSTVDAVVSDRGRPRGRAWPGATTTLVVRGSSVALGAEVWPAAHVGTVVRPQDVRASGVVLVTPTGPRLVTFVPGMDPAAFCSAVVDRVALAWLRRALTTAARASSE